MEKTLEITLRNDLSELERLSDILTTFCETHRLRSEVLLDVSTALEEIVTNVVSYAYDDADTHEIRIGVALKEAELTVEVEDDGRPFNPLDAPAPDLGQRLEDRPVGGLGIHLIRSLTDSTEYRREGTKNVLVFKKRTIAA